MTPSLPEVVDTDKISLDIVALRARQPIGDLYFGTIDAALIVRINDFDVRR